MKHTPGPWSADPEGAHAVSIEGADGSVVCDVHGAADDPLCEANAKLIAAAPALLEALRQILEWASLPHDDTPGNTAEAIRQEAREALTAVTGKVVA